MDLDATPCVESVFKHFRWAALLLTCEATRAENGFPVNSTETIVNVRIKDTCL